jgi:hypothetical protein
MGSARAIYPCPPLAALTPFSLLNGDYSRCAPSEAEMRLQYRFVDIYDIASERWGFAEAPRTGQPVKSPAMLRPDSVGPIAAGEPASTFPTFLNVKRVSLESSLVAFATTWAVQQAFDQGKGERLWRRFNCGSGF